jgi:cyclic-di-GMP-binding protein
MGAALVASAPVNDSESARFGYPAKLATSVRGRLKRLQTGSSPSELQLGHDCSAEQCTTLLGYLDSRWYMLPRRGPEGPSGPVELCAGGVPAAHFRVSGRSFVHKDPAKPMSFGESQQLHVAPPVEDYDRGREGAEHEWPWERWEGTVGTREAAVARSSDALHRWSLDQLAIARVGGRTRVGFVSRVALDASTDLALTLRLWSGVPKAIGLRALSAAGSEDAALPALLLDETPGDKASLVLPPRTFNPSRVMRSVDSPSERRFRLVRLLQRGIDFERVAFEETV